MADENTGLPSCDVAILLADFDNGGVVRVAVHLANGFKGAGLNIHLVVVRKQGPLLHLVDPGIHIEELGDQHFTGKRSKQLFQAIPRLSQYIKRVKPKSIFASGNHLFLYSWAGRALSFNRKTKFIFKLTNPIQRKNTSLLKRLSRNLPYRLLLPFVDCVFTIAPDGTEEMHSLLGNKASRVHFVHSLWVEHDCKPTAKPKPRPGHVINLLAIGRLVPQKDYPTLFRALAEIKNRPWVLNILGNGPDENALKALAKSLGIAQHINFNGFVLDPTPWYKSADIFVLSSVYEGGPAVLIEALSHGLPAVATNCSRLTTDTLSNPKLGIVTTVGDHKGLATALETAMNTQWDTAEAIEHAKLYTLENGTQDHLKVLRSYL